MRPNTRPRLAAILLAAAAPFAAAAPPAAAATTPIPWAIREQVEAKLAGSFVYPETSNYIFQDYRPYLGQDRVVCGVVDFQSSVKKYVGAHHFYAIVHDGVVGLTQLDDPVEDVSGERMAKMKLLCGF